MSRVDAIDAGNDADHAIEGVVLQHEDDDVLDCHEWTPGAAGTNARTQG